ISRSSTTRTRPTPSSPCSAPCARSPRARCTWCSAAAGTGTGPSGRRWAPPRPGSPTPPYSHRTTPAPRTRSRSSPPCSRARPRCPPTSAARCRSSRTGPPRSPPPSPGRSPVTPCWSPARATSRGRTSQGRCVPTTTARCFAKQSRRPRDDLVIALSLAEIAEVVGAQPHDIPDPSVQVTGPVVRDSREAGPGSLFVAFVGERADGHDFAAQVVEAGAAAVLASRPVGVPAIVVDDVQAALGALARHVVRRLGATLVALTGSAGKTSTKDLIAQVLRQKAPTVFTPGSLNNEIGLPLTALTATEDPRFRVLEMGARGLGHIRYLTGLTPPRIGLVLNGGSAHIGEFGGREQIAEAKGELVEALPEDGTAV